MATTTRSSSDLTLDALNAVVQRARNYVETVADRSVSPSANAVADLDKFHEPFPKHGADASVQWSMNASSCIVDTRSTNASVDATNGSVTFKSGTTGDIHLSCPIPYSIVQGGPWCSRLGMTWTDPDTTATKAEAGAFLHQMSFYSGGILTPLSLYFSGSTPALGNNPVNYVDWVSTGNTGAGDRYFAYDFTNFYYWVEIQLHRQDTTVNPPIVYGVTLDYNGGNCIL